MKLNDKLNKKTDLTRWNRSGLKQFRYIDGNAISYLETLKQELVEQYDNNGSAQWNSLLTRFPESLNETRYQKVKRLNNQYYDDRRDYAWEILRAFSRSAHILGEYIDAYANEAYLPTAIEWDNIRKLVATLDYSPSPPASAETHIALLYKKDEEGEIDKGYAVKNKPNKGELTAIFETQEKLKGSASVNQLHLEDWNKNLKPLKNDNSNGLNPRTIRFYLADDTTDEINVGDEGVIATPTQGFPIQVSKISKDEKGNFLILKGLKEQLKEFTLFNTTLYLQPSFVSSPLANGAGSATLNKTSSLGENEVIFTENKGVFTARRITKSELNYLQFEDNEKLAKAGESIIRARTLKNQTQVKLHPNKKVFVLPHGKNNVVLVNKKLDRVSPKKVEFKKIDGVEFSYIVDHHSFDGELYYIDINTVSKFKKEELLTLIQVGNTNVEKIRFSGKTTELESGQWCLVDHKKEGGNRAAYLISQINVNEETFSLTLNESSQSVFLLRSAFKYVLKHKDYDINHRRAGYGDNSGTVTILELNDTNLVNCFNLGQKIICSSNTNAVTVEVKDLKDNKLYVSPKFHHEKGFTRNNTLIYGNVVRATHGETQPEKIVGNGDASQTSQCFELTSDSISWIADAAFSTGVRADLSLRVGHRIWQQVQDLYLSASEDHHYMVKVDQDNTLKVCFGDGRHGRRLPTGVDNVRVRFRNGYGESGNLEALVLVKVARPHSLIDGFIAPLPSVGGAEKESSESMRESAPATVLALSRAVSLDDFTHLASHHSMVWQAKAFEKIPGKPARSQIEIVAVAAGGAVFQNNSGTAKLIHNFLISHCAPGMSVSVVSFRPLNIQLKILVMVDSAAYDQKQVEQSVREFLETELVIKNRKLGQSLFRSEIIALIEQVKGVENGHCEILAGPYTDIDSDEKPILHKGDDGEIKKVTVKPDQLLYLDSKSYPLLLSSLEYKV